MYLQMLQEYEEGADMVVQAVKGLSKDVIDAVPEPDRWSIHEIIVHLSDSEIVASDRIRRALAEDNATVQVYNEVEWARRLDNKERDYDLALALLVALRKVNVDLLANLRRKDWQRTAIHSERGPLTVGDFVQTYIGLMKFRVEQINRIKKEHGIG
ncbi:MAG TPA: DinB family protein [Armatimonadota bacterium]